MYQISNGNLTYKKLAGGINGSSSDSCGIRPVVTLESGVHLIKKIEDKWEIKK